MNEAAEIAGYLVYDDGRPVCRVELSRGVEYWPKFNGGTAPVALFTSIRDARKAKRSIQQRHRAQANKFDPNHSADEQRCFGLWRDRAKGVRISRVRAEVAR